MNKNVVVGGQLFSKDIYDYLMTRFKESFSHASLSVEQAFEELDDCIVKLNQIQRKESHEYYELLDRKEKKEIDNYLKQFIVFYGYQTGVLNGTFNPKWTQREIDEIFNCNFKYMLDDARYVLLFDKDSNFLVRDTFRNVGSLFQLSFLKKNAEDTAYNMEYDHVSAFDYALSLDNIGIPEIININEKVNHTRPNKEVGYKKTNNTIIGANFKVVDKKNVASEMQRLMSDYNDDFGMEILPVDDPMISHKEREARLLKIFEKEALFHIRFERIHPFADGNGRTGRIIMNKHLIDNNMAPVLITGVMTDEYKEYINNYDYEGLAKMMLSSSSQLLSNWVSLKLVGIKHKLFEQKNKMLKKDMIKYWLF